MSVQTPGSPGQIRLGCAPIAWNNEDLHAELGPPFAYTTLLDEVVAAGYSGTELGLGFPRQPAILRRELEERGLAMPSAWCGLRLLEDSAETNLEHARRVCDLLNSVGASFVNLADQGTYRPTSLAFRAAHPDAPTLSVVEWDQLAEEVCRAAEIARSHGLQATFHLHAGSWVETRADLEQLLRRAPAPLLKLCWDVGHAMYGGVDPVTVVREHPDRIAYIHLKDVDPAVLECARREHLPFPESVRRRIFTEVGRGMLDVPALLGSLREIGYAGWLMVEQDSTWRAPIESARISRAYLGDLGL